MSYRFEFQQVGGRNALQKAMKLANGENVHPNTPMIIFNDVQLEEIAPPNRSGTLNYSSSLEVAAVRARKSSAIQKNRVKSILVDRATNLMT